MLVLCCVTCFSVSLSTSVIIEGGGSGAAGSGAAGDGAGIGRKV